jgi:mono/diheme cytochrome c family protein
MMRVNSSMVAAIFVVTGSLVFGQAQEHEQHKPGAKPSPSAQTSPHKDSTHTHAAAAKIPNPVKPDDGSKATGEKLFATHCATCHGLKGAGDGVQAAKYTPRPSDLTDAEWKHGPSDGEIFTVIRSGVPKTAMGAFSRKISERQTWEVVNYVRSLGPKVAPAHAH